MIRFTDEHEWLTRDGDIATVGITDHAATQLGDLVFIELPKIGRKLKKGDVAAVVESVKTASDVFAPLDGEVLEVNDAIVKDPAIVNAEPLAKGWLYRMRLANSAEFDDLMDDAAYKALIG